MVKIKIELEAKDLVGSTIYYTVNKEGKKNICKGKVVEYEEDLETFEIEMKKSSKIYRLDEISIIKVKN